MNRRLDLADQHFGELTVLRPAENVGKRTAWVCRCGLCGREFVALTVRLRDGRCTSCGCGKATDDPTPGACGRASLTYVDGTCVEMLQARTVRGNNTSGVPGVDWLAKKQRWRASICFKGKRKYLGSYESFEDAVKARKQAEESLFDTFLDVQSGKAPESALRDIDEACPPRGRPDQRLDLANRRFGYLKVLAPAENVGSMTAWRCRCECGKELTVTTAHLRSGQESCGCKRKWTFVDGTFVELIRSRKIRRNNTSGATGVEWVPSAGKWKAAICFKGKRKYLGSYESFEDAVKVRRRAEEELFEAFLSEFAEAQSQDAGG